MIGVYVDVELTTEKTIWDTPSPPSPDVNAPGFIQKEKVAGKNSCAQNGRVRNARAQRDNKLCL